MATTDGRHEAMWIGDLERLISDAELKPNWRLYMTRWGERSGLAPGNVTIHFGNPKHEVLMDRNFDEEVWMNNVSAPQIPEHNIVEGQQIKYRGWRSMLRGMVQGRIIRLTDEIEEWLGTEVCDKIRSHRRLAA